MMVMSYAIDVIGYGRRTSKLSNASLYMKQYANSFEKYPSFIKLT